MMELEESRKALMLGVERFALAARYFAYIILAAVFFMGGVEGALSDFIVVTLVVLVHNAFAHWVIFTDKTYLFRHPINFAVYLMEASIVVYFTGADESTLYSLYILVLVGFGAYSRRFKQIIMATMACCLAYGAVLFVEWRLAGLVEPWGPLVARLLVILSSGWLVGLITDFLWHAELGYVSQAEAAASTGESLRAVLDSAPDPILVFDELEFVVDANERASEYFRESREHLLGQRVRAYLFDDGTLPSKMANLRAKGEYRGEQLLLDAEGDEHAADVVVRSFVREQHRYFVLVVHDVTEQKRLQEATLLANANLERLNKELQQVDELKTGFLATISQKLRSPLSAVIGYLDMLLGEELGEINVEQRRAVQTCRRATLRAFRLMDQALDLSGREPAVAPLKPSPDRGKQKLDVAGEEEADPKP